MNDDELIICKVVCYNQAKIDSLKKHIPSEQVLSDGSEIFKAIGHPQRLAILHVLLESECCVCDLANVLDQPVSTISQHLKILKTAGLLSSRQDGKLVFYTVNKPEFIKNSIVKDQN
ncbi:MAG: metalloregulator ArsR/SmtB family transcription factor [bacterium]